MVLDCPSPGTRKTGRIEGSVTRDIDLSGARAFVIPEFVWCREGSMDNSERAHRVAREQRAPGDTVTAAVGRILRRGRWVGRCRLCSCQESYTWMCGEKVPKAREAYSKRSVGTIWAYECSKSCVIPAR